MVSVSFLFVFLVTFLCLSLTRIKPDSARTEKIILTTNDFVPIELSINESANPCNDFYSFSCGNWAENSVFKSHEGLVNTFSVLSKKVMSSVKDIFIHTIASEDQPIIVNWAVQFYNGCVTSGHDDFNEEVVDVFKNYVQELGGWPLLDGSSFNESSYSVIDAIAYLLKTLYIETVFGVKISVNEGNTSLNSIWITPPELPKMSEINSAIFIPDLYSFVQVLNCSKLNYTELVNEFYEIQSNLEQWITAFKPSNESEVESKTLTVKQLCEEIPDFNWIYFLQAVVNDSLHTLSPTLSDDEIVVVYDMDYLKKAVGHLNSGVFAKRQIANLFGWFISDDVHDVIPGVVQESLEFFEHEKSEVELYVKNHCYDKLLELSEAGLEYLFIKNFTDFNPENSLTLIKYLEMAFRELLQNATWLDNTTKINALIKLDKMIKIVGYSKIQGNKIELDNIYENLPPVGSNVLDNYFLMKKYLIKMAFSKLKTENTVSNILAQRPVYHVSAYYVLMRNALVFPLSMHLPPFYYKDGPWFLNFGTIGAIIGHEMMHAFDTSGHSRDKRGNPYNWWTNTSLEIYDERSLCYAEQYSGYKDIRTCKNIDGYEPKRLGENIADNEGLRLAYTAYKLWESDHGAEEGYHQLEHYTPDQMLFLAFGSVWCSYVIPQADLLKHVYPHSPPENRVNGVVSNSKYFSNAFHCMVNDSLNPDQKCTIW